MKKKWSIIGGVILALFLGGWIAIPQLESSLLASLENEALDTRIQQELQSTGLRLTYQGKRFEILYGFILKGARLEKEQDGQYVPVAEFRNLVLSVSYFRWLTGGDPLKSIRSYSGRIHSSSLFSRSGNFLDVLSEFLQTRDIDISLNNVSWESGPGSRQSGVMVDVYLAPAEEGLELDFNFHGSSGEIRFHGTLTEQNRRVFVTLSDVPLDLMLEFLRTSESVPSLHILPEWAEFRGIINGRGSMDLREPGTAANLEGSIIDLNLTGSEPFGLELKNVNGQYKFSQVYSYEDGVLQSDIQIRSPDLLDTSLSYRLKKEGLPHELTLKGKTTFSNTATESKSAVTTSFLHCRGQVEYDIRMRYNDSLQRVELIPDIKLNSFELLGPPDWPNSQEPLAILNLHVDGKEQRITGTGQVLDGKIKIDSKGGFSLAKRGEDHRLTLVQNLDHSVEIHGLSYEKLTAATVNAHSWILNRASRPDARKAEDGGPLWENQFIDSAIYTQLLSGLNWKGQVRLMDLQGGRGLPKQATLRMDTNALGFNLSLNENTGEPGLLRGRYMGVWNEQLPSHTLSLNIKQKELSINWAPTGKKGPSRVSIDANFTSSGVFPADLINYSNGQLYFEAYEMDLKVFAPFELGMRMLGRKIPEGPVIGDIEVVRSGTGQEIEYYRIVVKTPDLVARGGGRYSIYEGGSTWLNVAQNGREEKLNFQIQKNGKWLPDDGL